MTLDFAALPPEINSARIYTGPGSGPMIAAAGAWGELAVGLEHTAASYSSVVSELTGGSWLGPSSAAMAAAVAPFVAWLQHTATLAEQAALQATEAAAAFETAFAMTVPPPVIAANRATLTALIATNFFGQNTPAIAATEAHYVQMWAQDATAMYGYAGTAATATALTPFDEPPATTDGAGPGAQHAAVAHAGGTATRSQMGRLARLNSGISAGLQQLTGTGTGSGSGSTGVPLFDSMPFFSSASVLGVDGLIGPTFLGQNSFFLANAGFLANSQVNLGTRAAGIKTSTERQAVSTERFAEKQAAKLRAGLGSARPVSVSAGTGQAASVGSLSVPASWAREPVAIRPAALTLPGIGSDVPAAAAPLEPMPGSVFSQGLMSALTNDAPPPAHPKTKSVLVHNPASERGGCARARS